MTFVSSKEIINEIFFDQPLRLVINIERVILYTALYTFGSWSISAFPVSKRYKAVFISLLNTIVFVICFVDSLIVRMLLIEAMAIASSVSCFTKDHQKHRSFNLVSNSFALSLLTLMIVLNLSEISSNYTIITGGTYLIFFIIRTGILRELFINTMPLTSENAPIQEQYLSILTVVTIFYPYVIQTGWSEVYIHKFAFVFFVSFSLMMLFILNTSKNSCLGRVSKLKYMIIIVAFINVAEVEPYNLPFIQLVAFFFLWEILYSYSYVTQYLEKLRWLVIVLIVGPVPLLPFQKSLLEGLKDILSKDIFLGVVACFAVLGLLCLIPSGMFKDEEELLT